MLRLIAATMMAALTTAAFAAPVTNDALSTIFAGDNPPSCGSVADGFKIKCIKAVGDWQFGSHKTGWTLQSGVITDGANGPGTEAFLVYDGAAPSDGWVLVGFQHKADDMVGRDLGMPIFVVR